jgi:hypothetical protein
MLNLYHGPIGYPFRQYIPCLEFLVILTRICYNFWGIPPRLVKDIKFLTLYENQDAGAPATRVKLNCHSACYLQNVLTLTRPILGTRYIRCWGWLAMTLRNLFDQITRKKNTREVYTEPLRYFLITKSSLVLLPFAGIGDDSSVRDMSAASTVIADLPTWVPYWTCSARAAALDQPLHIEVQSKKASSELPRGGRNGVYSFSICSLW